MEPKNAGDKQAGPPEYYYIVMVSNIIVSILVITLFIVSSFDARRFSLLPEVAGAMIEKQVSMQVRLDALENKIDELKRELEELKKNSP